MLTQIQLQALPCKKIPSKYLIISENFNRLTKCDSPGILSGSITANILNMF